MFWKCIPTRYFFRHGSFRDFHLNHAFVSVLGALEDIVENCQVDDNLLTWNWFKS